MFPGPRMVGTDLPPGLGQRQCGVRLPLAGHTQASSSGSWASEAVAAAGPGHSARDNQAPG